jgi:hypothetical protein
MAFEVVSYTPAAFRDFLIALSVAEAPQVNAKLASGYWDQYLAAIGVRTIVTESDYIDHDYFEDFSAYYVKCFTPYRRICHRLHFFTSEFDQARLDHYLEGQNDLGGDVLESSYAGFMVVRPLPNSVIGRTCLGHYGADGGRRRFPTALPYNAHVFGLKLQVDTVPFQEQDQVTAACATSALWSALHVTGRRFQHHVPSPVEITRAATQHMPLRSRAFPNTDGLTIEQMSHAIRAVGLEPYYVSGADELPLRAAIYAYVAAGIPALLVFSLREANPDGTSRERGLHAAAVTGFSLPAKSPGTGSPPVAAFSFAKIDKFYVHDDQVGPHARMEIVDSGQAGWHLTTSWGLQQSSAISAKPIAVLLPLYNKIRIPYKPPLEDALNFAAGLNGLGQVVPGLADLSWDFRLTTLNQFRAELRDSPNISGATRRELLTLPLPRFIWRATAARADVPAVDILFDATDITTGRYVRKVIVYDAQLEAVLNHVATLHGAIPDLLNRVFKKRGPAAP